MLSLLFVEKSKELLIVVDINFGVVSKPSLVTYAVHSQSFMRAS